MGVDPIITSPNEATPTYQCSWVQPTDAELVILLTERF